MTLRIKPDQGGKYSRVVSLSMPLLALKPSRSASTRMQASSRSIEGPIRVEKPFPARGIGRASIGILVQNDIALAKQRRA